MENTIPRKLLQRLTFAIIQKGMPLNAYEVAVIVGQYRRGI